MAYKNVISRFSAKEAAQVATEHAQIKVNVLKLEKFKHRVRLLQCTHIDTQTHTQYRPIEGSGNDALGREVHAKKRRPNLMMHFMVAKSVGELENDMAL